MREYASRTRVKLSLLDLPFEGTPVLSDDEFDRAAEEIERIVSGAGIPALV